MGNKVSLLGLSGFAGSGKDEAAKAIQELMPGEWHVKRFSGKLKQIASILTGIPEEKFEDQEFKKTNLGPEWNYLVGYLKPIGHGSVESSIDSVPMTVRMFLQNLGTDAIRKNLHHNAWVNALFADYKPVDTRYLGINQSRQMPNWVIPDVRFKNEAQAIKDRGGIIIRVDRPGVGPVNNHPSETELNDGIFDYKIANASDLISLKQSVKVILEKEELL